MTSNPSPLAASRVSSRVSSTAPSWGQRLGWLVLIWASSVAALAVVALVFRLLMRAAGMSN